MYKRQILQNFPVKNSSFLFGARQCGKSTVLSAIPAILRIDLLSTDDFLTYNSEPGLLYKRVQALDEKEGFAIIDEVQKIPPLLDEVQRCIDKYPGLFFILSGSSARKLKRGLANMLGGRALYFTLHPLTVTELAQDFDLETVLKFGSLPKIATTLKRGEKSLAVRLLKSYVKTYLQEEIRAEALVRQLDGFQRFLQIAASQYAREINFSYIAEEALISAYSVKGHYEILEDTLLGFFLHPYSTSIRKELSKTPKFYFFDNGVTRALQGVLSNEVTNLERGWLFEQWVAQEIFRINAYHEKDFKINFWKTAQGAEVDFILSRGNEILLAIECKASPYPSARDLSGLKSFAEEYPGVKRVICSPVTHAVEIQAGYIAHAPEYIFKIIADL